MTSNAFVQESPSWRGASLLVAVGAIVLGIGLLLGPTPSNDSAQALRDIDEFHTRYVVTNAIGLVGILIMGAGLVTLARLQMSDHGGATALIGGVANASGAVLIALTVVLQSTVDPAAAQRFVVAAPPDQAAMLAIGETVTEFGGAVFGVGFLLQMIGIALVAVTFLTGVGPRLNRVFLMVGALLAVGASTMGIGALFEDVMGDIEALLGLIALAWLIGLCALLERSRTHR